MCYKYMYIIYWTMLERRSLIFITNFFTFIQAFNYNNWGKIIMIMPNKFEQGEHGTPLYLENS